MAVLAMEAGRLSFSLKSYHEPESGERDFEGMLLLMKAIFRGIEDENEAVRGHRIDDLMVGKG